MEIEFEPLDWEGGQQVCKGVVKGTPIQMYKFSQNDIDGGGGKRAPARYKIDDHWEWNNYPINFILGKCVWLCKYFATTK